jgi:TRAP-type C4-dicarboxylate transport system permease small subunit
LTLLKRFDEGLARGEAMLAMLWLLAMIGAGATQAFFRFCATRIEAEWANPILQSLDWVDPLLHKGTLWLAFLGASLATREGRHIAIDIVPRIAPHKARLVMHGVVGLAASAIAFVLSRAFWAQVKRIAEEGSAYTLYGASGDQIHMCEATAAELSDAGIDGSPISCGFRSAFDAIGITLDNPQAALQFVIPVMFIVIAVRLLANAIGAFISLGKPAPDPVANSVSNEAGEG